MTAIYTAFFTYVIITSITPGPNNILSLSIATQYGLKRSTKVISGMFCGYVVLMLLCGAFTYNMISLLPVITPWLTWIGAAYIVWLAWGLATSEIKTSSDNSKGISFLTGFGLQFVNVKIILYGITSISTFVLPHTQNIYWILATSLILALIALLSNVVWAVAGKLLQSHFQRYGKVINMSLAAALIYCATQLFT
ncbi:cysteine/O-acetylserine transporter [Vibrio sp. 2026]|uniref:cysteine/O-acetylserine transporter n=1 Tax=Vibrio TaxID=662 RepID=UPI000DF9B6B4|nr:MULTISPECIES: cysteine/O-acetylserine transporter [Vibrio]MDG2626426.1 cysteine/O-acetylserine transporter [Vibrio parahaemolyticus]EJL6726676.1 cysteine/O-acetylserine transporter [Vibrio alginolyticus]MBS9893743.1 cysteine/O-acetylserine transporter [Vibrio alginolyticus]MDW1516253.1 cysteine/O-acetylserine transporter [Vibrio sp. Vb5035]MDW1546501.1 cysteine/O-acetylserine transporter [Vibrio sp. Vb5034]